MRLATSARFGKFQPEPSDGSPKRSPSSSRELGSRPTLRRLGSGPSAEAPEGDLSLPGSSWPSVKKPEEALLKAELVRSITRLIDARGLTQVQAARILGVDQPKVSLLYRGQLGAFSVERDLFCPSPIAGPSAAAVVGDGTAEDVVRVEVGG